MTKGGIHIPEAARQKPQWSMVTKVGPGPWHDALMGVDAPAAPGDLVLHGKYAGVEIELPNGTEKLLILSAGDILAVQKRST